MPGTEVIPITVKEVFINYSTFSWKDKARVRGAWVNGA